MQVAKRMCHTRRTLRWNLCAWITHRVLRVPHQNNFATVHECSLIERPVIFAHPLGFMILHLRVALAFSERKEDFYIAKAEQAASTGAITTRVQSTRRSFGSQRRSAKKTKGSAGIEKRINSPRAHTK